MAQNAKPSVKIDRKAVHGWAGWKACRGRMAINYGGSHTIENQRALEEVPIKWAQLVSENVGKWRASRLAWQWAEGESRVWARNHRMEVAGPGSFLASQLTTDGFDLRTTMTRVMGLVGCDEVTPDVFKSPFEKTMYKYAKTSLKDFFSMYMRVVNAPSGKYSPTIEEQGEVTPGYNIDAILGYSEEQREEEERETNE